MGSFFAFYHINKKHLLALTPCFAALLLMPVLMFGQGNEKDINGQGANFSFVLKDSCRTSAGVYTKDSILVRTLWSGKKEGPGIHTGYWDGTDDDGRLAEAGNYDVRVLSNSVSYTWEGVLGNNSDAFTGSTVFRGYNLINGMAVAGNTAYYSKGYSEGSPSYAKFLTTNSHAKQWIGAKWQIPSLTTNGVTTDGVNVYWANIDPPDTAHCFVFATTVAGDAEKLFGKGAAFTTKFGVAFRSVVDLVNNKNGKPTGIAVQARGRYLLIAHAGLNEIHVLDKNTGETVQVIPMNSPLGLAMDEHNKAWVICTENNERVVKKFDILDNGMLLPTKVSLPGIEEPLAVAVSPVGNIVVVADGGSKQQVKAFNDETGGVEWVYGRQGGYANDPLVTYDKFYFSDKRLSFSRVYQTFIAFQPDGSFWVGDPGNARTLRFSADRRYMDEIMYLPVSYSCVADPNNPSRVFSDYLEFKVAYNKPLAANNGSWKLVRNWGAVVPDSLAANNNHFVCLTTLKNGRTYALFSIAKTTLWQLAELPPAGPLRFTGITIPGFPITMLHSDGSLRTTPRAVINKPVVWTIRKLAGFDKENNPLWGNDEVLATSPPAAKQDPFYWGGGILHSGEITSTNILVSFDNGLPPYAGTGYHLGGIKLGGNKWLWKTAASTDSKYTGVFPADGSYDIGNQVMYGGSVHIADGRNIFWGYHGEFWKSSQVNKWNHVWDDGLLVGQFGVTGLDDPSEAAAGMAGNVFSASLVQIGDSAAYLYHNDESYHSGVHRWRISGLNTINEQVLSVTLPAAKHGLVAKLYDDTLLNSVNKGSGSILSTNSRSAQPYSVAKKISTKQYAMSLTGYVKPLTDEVYSFYTGRSEGSRLYIDGRLLVDNYKASGVDSGSIYLAKGKQYPFLAEFYKNSGNELPVLFWGSKTIAKQPVPLSQLTPASLNAPQPDVVDLMQGLPNNGIVENGLHGWARYPAEEDSTNRQTKWWNVRTNIKKFAKRQSPDVYIYRRQGTGTAQVTRNLGNYTSPITNWRLFGNINYEKNFPNVGTTAEAAGSGGCFFEVLDKNEKVLVRFYPVVMHYWDDVRLYANDKLIFQANIADFKKLVEHPNSIDITCADGKLTVQFANLRAITLGSFDPAGTLENPQTMRVFFWGNGNNFDRIIDLEGFYFDFSKSMHKQ